MKILKIFVLIFLLVIAAFIGINWQLFQDNINPLFYRRGPDMTIRLEEFTERMTEADVVRRASEIPLSCEDNSAALPLGNHICYSNIGSYAGVRALRVVFFFLEGHLANVKVDIPWWSHSQMAKRLIKDLGKPTGGQTVPVEGVRLVGWQVKNGNILFNRDPDRNPLMWNTIHWMSPLESEKRGGIFIPSRAPDEKQK